MQQQIFNDPASGRPYYIDPATNQAVWADQPTTPIAPVVPMAPMAPVVPAAPLPGAPTFDPAQMGAAAQAAMGVQPVGIGGTAVEVQLNAYDFSQVEDKIIMVLDPAVAAYEFVVTDIKGKKSAAGDDLLEVHLGVCWPLTLPNGQACKGASIIDNISMSPNALWKAKSFLAACEMLGANGRFTGQKLAELKGCVVRASIRNETWNETLRTKISGGYTAGFETPGMNVAPATVGPQGFAPPAMAQQVMPQPVVQAPVAPQAPVPQAPAPQAPMAPQMPAAPQMPGLPAQTAAPGPAPQPSFPQAPQLPPGAPMPQPPAPQ